MKKIYLTLFIAFLGGQLMAQSSTITTNDQSTIKGATGTATSTSTTNQTNVVLSDLPGFPAYVNTGNKSVDDANYGIAKKNWIIENNDIYSIYTRKKGSLSTSVSLVGFPVYQNTGNSDLDYSNYKEARANWMLNNESLYVEYINSIRK